ncbi:hypothetical protein ACF07T_40005 [Streptomyces sp. NPDC015184]|uniref:hypothetical protein n=1 Tax=Streptomyces sp. NPDC015184 TaxID=3364946 RepID=UPI0036FC3E7B
MSTPSSAGPAPSEDQGYQPLTLGTLRRLVKTNWARLPGETLVVLSHDVEGNCYSPFSSYTLGRYALSPESTGEVYPLESEIAADPELRDLYEEIPADARAALVLYPLG